MEPEQVIEVKAKIDKHLMFPTEDWGKVEKMQSYAYQAGLIDKNEFHSFIKFALNCAYQYIRDFDMKARKKLG